MLFLQCHKLPIWIDGYTTHRNGKIGGGFLLPTLLGMLYFYIRDYISSSGICPSNYSDYMFNGLV